METDNQTSAQQVVSLIQAGRVVSNPARALNTPFQISTTSDAIAVYTVQIDCTLTLAGGQRGAVYLESCADSSFSSGVTVRTKVVNGNTGTLTVGLSLTQNITGSLAGILKAGNWFRLRTSDEVGTPAYTLIASQECLL